MREAGWRAGVRRPLFVCGVGGGLKWVWCVVGEGSGLRKDQGPQPNRHAHRGLHHTCPLKIEEPVSWCGVLAGVVFCQAIF